MRDWGRGRGGEGTNLLSSLLPATFSLLPYFLLLFSLFRLPSDFHPLHSLHPLQNPLPNFFLLPTSIGLPSCTSVTSCTLIVAELPSSVLGCYLCFVWLEGSCQAGLFASAVVTVQYTFFHSFVYFAIGLRHPLLDFLH